MMQSYDCYSVLFTWYCNLNKDFFVRGQRWSTEWFRSCRRQPSLRAPWEEGSCVHKEWCIKIFYPATGTPVSFRWHVLTSTLRISQFWYMYVNKCIFCKSSWPPHSTLTNFRNHIRASVGWLANNPSNKPGMVWIEFAGSYQKNILLVAFSRWWSIFSSWILEDGYTKRALSSRSFSSVLFLCFFMLVCALFKLRKKWKFAPRLSLC